MRLFSEGFYSSFYLTVVFPSSSSPPLAYSSFLSSLESVGGLAAAEEISAPGALVARVVDGGGSRYSLEESWRAAVGGLASLGMMN